MNAETRLNRVRIRKGRIWFSGMAALAVILVVAIASWRQPSGEGDRDEPPDPCSHGACEARFEALENQELEELLERKRRFEQLPEARQRYLRAMHEEWLANADRDALLRTMRAYSQWLMTLSAEDRAEVKSGTLPERLQTIAELRRKQAEALFGVAGETQLPRADVSALFEWSMDFIRKRQAEILQIVGQRSGSGRENDDDSRGGRDRLRPEWAFWSAGRIRPEALVDLIQEKDIDDLKTLLSPEAVAIIDAQGDLPSRQKLIFRWMDSAMDALRNPDVPERELREFFETEMTSDERKHIESMEPNQRMRAVRFYYNRRNMRRMAPNLFPPAPESGESPRDKDRDRRDEKSPFGN